MDDGTQGGNRPEGREAPVFDERPLDGGPPEAPDERWWSDVDRRHRVLRMLAIWGGIGVAALAVGAAVTLLGQRLSTGPAKIGGGTPTLAAPATSALPPSADGTSTATPTVPATSSVTSTPSVSAVKRAALVAYRLDDSVWVADESGENAQRLITSTDGPFSLSPDGRTLALADAASKTLLLLDVASHATIVVGSAELDRPSWSRDSAFVVYTSMLADGPDTVVRRVSRDASSHSELGKGAMPRVTPTGSVIAVSATRTASGVPLVVFAGGKSKLLGGAMNIDAVAASTSTIAFCDAGSPGVQSAARQPSLGVMRFDGTGVRTLVKRPAAGASAFFGDVAFSPDGKRLVYAESGDDGYSRLWIVPTVGGTTRLISSRRDAYIVGFSADGTQLFYVDGNALQGESTRLMAVGLDGKGRRLVVDGAGQ